MISGEWKGKCVKVLITWPTFSNVGTDFNSNPGSFLKAFDWSFQLKKNMYEVYVRYSCYILKELIYNFFPKD